MAVCGANPEASETLEAYGVEVITAQPISSLRGAVSTHADMLCCHLGGRHVVTAGGQLAETLGKRGFMCTKTEDTPCGEYPRDVSLNCAVIGDVLVANVYSAAREILSYANENFMKICSVRQGYAKCSTAIVTEKAAITADRGIATALMSRYIDTLLITPGYIELSGYDYGFIGGACGKIANDKMLFFGDITRHPNCAEILRFLHKHSVDAITAPGSLTDVGGFIPLEENRINLPDLLKY